jgi:hypothetical protein
MNVDGPRPTPERLAAYADGELHGPDRAAIEAWLDICPPARAEVEAMRHLNCQCRRTTAPEPSPDAWDAVLNNLHAALPAGARSRFVPRPRRRSFVPALAAAAAIVVGILVGRGFWTESKFVPPTSVSTSQPALLVGPLDLVSSRDIDIISMGGQDTAILLVGRPPIHDAMQLAGPGDVTLVGIESVDGFVPDLRRNGAVTMIVPPSAADAP